LTCIAPENSNFNKVVVGGKVIISEILRNIDDCDIFIADVTGVNANVMFELGYAIGVKKRIWLTLDGTRASAKRDYEQFRLLVLLRYKPA
jgi:nucleoside 2-deoxyribosyltransferase